MFRVQIYEQGKSGWNDGVTDAHELLLKAMEVLTGRIQAR